MYDTIAQRMWGKIEVYCCKVLTLHMKRCGIILRYIVILWKIVNSMEATLEMKQKGMVNKPIMERKWDHLKKTVSQNWNIFQGLSTVILEF